MINKFVDKTFFRFIIVGVLNTLVGTTIMFVCYNWLKCNYWFSSAMNYVVGSIVSYFLNKYYTFKNTSKDWKIVIKFIINIVVCYTIAYGIAKPLVTLVLKSYSVIIQENIAMVVGMVLYVGLNYVGQRYFAFKEEE